MKDGFELKDRYTLEDVPRLIARLRDPENGCPWDAEQTHASIRQNFLEETCEALDAMDRNCSEDITEELGDVLFQVAIHARMEEEAGEPGIDGISDALIKKMVYRHPHVFGGEQVSGSGEVLRNWEDIKRTEKSQKKGADAVDAVPVTLPALMRMQKIQKRAAYVGFDMADGEEALRCLVRSVEALENAAAEEREKKLADVLFCAVALARKEGLDAELLLTRECETFAGRFRLAEKLAGSRGIDMKEADASVLKNLWDGAAGDEIHEKK